MRTGSTRTSSITRFSDPACGNGRLPSSRPTNGSSRRRRAERLTAECGEASEKTRPNFGGDLVCTARPARRWMNLFLHGINRHPCAFFPVTLSYEVPGSEPFRPRPYEFRRSGRKGANQAPDRDDFTVSTSNKQLNFLQHVLTILIAGRPGAAVISLPDNCLFLPIRPARSSKRSSARDCDLHNRLATSRAVPSRHT